MSKIKKVLAREILDSRGNPTLEVNVILDKFSAIASVPSGASTGLHEAVELRDGDISRFAGLGVLNAVKNVNNEIVNEICNKDFDQESLDDCLIKLDGTKNKSRLGANAILGVSMAFARAVADEKGLELYEYIGQLGKNKKFTLPQPALNIINGGKHADSGLDIQEFMLIPKNFSDFHKKIEAGSAVIKSLKKILQKNGYSIGIGDEGGFAPQLKSNEEAFELMLQAISDAGYTTDQIKIGIDAASSSFFENGNYHISVGEQDKKLNSSEMISWYEELVKKYPIISIEDGLDEDDWDGFSQLTKKLGDKVTIVGDDLFVTNIERVKIGIEKDSANSVLIKLNQIGTVSETIQTIKMAQNKGWIPFVSHRSGETTDTFIADLAVGMGCQYIKAGSLARGERVCKYNRLMEIEDRINN